MSKTYPKTRSVLGSAVSVLALTVLVGGCSTTAPSDASNGTAITVALSAPVDCLDPHQAPEPHPLHIARQIVAISPIKIRKQVRLSPGSQTRGP